MKMVAPPGVGEVVVVVVVVGGALALKGELCAISPGIEKCPHGLVVAAVCFLFA